MLINISSERSVSLNLSDLSFIWNTEYIGLGEVIIVSSTGILSDGLLFTPGTTIGRLFIVSKLSDK